MARCSTEAEYRSLVSASAKIVWLQSMFLELGISLSTLVLWCDNFGATFLASNPAFYARTKHIDLNYHFIREKMAARSIKVQFICSQDQTTTDALTKLLSTTCFAFLRSKLTVRCPIVRLRGLINCYMCNIKGEDDCYATQDNV
jgi:hypothetical protein